MAKSMFIRPIFYLLLALVELNMAQQNPFYGDQTPPPYNDQNPDYRRRNDQNNSYDRYNYDSNNRYDPNNRYDQNNRSNQDPNSRYDSNNRYNTDPNNRYDQNNRYNDPYNRNNDSNYRNNDQYYRYNESNRYNDPQIRYNQSGNRYNDPYNRYNESGNRYNDPYNRYNESGNRYNDPYNRNNESGSRYNDPYNRNNDPNGRYNQDQYNRYNTTNNYNLGSDLNPNYRNNERYNNQDPYGPYNRYNVSGGGNYNQDGNRYNNQYDRNDPNNRYNQQNQYNQQNRNNNPFNQGRPDYGQNNDVQGRPYESTSGQQFGYQADPNDNCCEEYCYRTDENPSLHFGTKTAYQIVFGRKPNQDVPECTPVLMWSINRQGTSTPTQQEIRRLRSLENIRIEILKNYDERRSFPYKGKLCNQDLDLLRRWRWNDTLSENREKVLTSQGIEDAKFLARRYKSKYPSLLNQVYRDNYYNFQYDMNNYKTHDTYQAYIEGLFDYGKSFNVRANTELSERTLPPSQCKTVMREVEQNSYTFSEYERFKQRPDYLQMVRDVFKRLGFRYTGDEAVIRNMYDMCRYEKAWYLNDPSPWCSVFNRKQLELLEYAEDLQDYYYSGYGNPANAKVGCLLVKDMFEMMKKVVNGEPADAYKVSHYFTHSTQFLRFLTAMGIAKDHTPLTADNYYQQKSRQWKLSQIDPFGANLVAVLYHCQRENKNKVMFLLNEVPVNFPECSVGLCDWNTVEQKYRSVAENCNSDYCEHGAAVNLSAAVPLMIFTMSFLLLSRRLF
ncbi:multiple inositol polyphosphate phosphatase 1-like isoform X2 [Coccinella septempunctata]|nr:multiple inositol polyphosphate phosphatase 1-like isoform X2 [Coccinella septempunctata]